MTTHFLKAKIRVSTWIFLHFSSQVKKKYLRTFCQVFATDKWSQWEWFKVSWFSC